MARFLLAFLIFISSASVAQEKLDVITKLNGEEVKGKVTEITDTEIKFTYAGETVVYVLKKSEIQKISFASGRTEVYNKSTSVPEATAAPAAAATTPDSDRRNKVAIFPFALIRDGQSSIDENSYKIQNEVFSILNKHKGIYTILDTRTTNALLQRAGVTKDNINGFTGDELCKLVGAEYVIFGTTTVDHKSQTTSGSSSYNVKNNTNQKSSSSTNNVSGYNNQTTMDQFSTSVLMSVYNDKGQSVFNEERKSVWTNADAYKSSIEYLLKRTPFYSK